MVFLYVSKMSAQKMLQSHNLRQHRWYVDFWETAAAGGAIWKLAEETFLRGKTGILHIYHQVLKLCLQKQTKIMYVMYVCLY